MSLYIVNIHGDIEGDYEIVRKYEEPKTGHWIMEDMFDGDVAYRCSECNELFWLESGTPKDNEYNFCPKCGKRTEYITLRKAWWNSPYQKGGKK